MREWAKLNTTPLNFVDEVRAGIELPERVLIHDTTMRDGEQFAGVVFTAEDKLRIATALSEAGVDRIELMPTVSQDDFEVVKTLTSQGLDAQVAAFCRSIRTDVERAAEAGCRHIELEVPAHPILHRALGWSEDDAVGKIAEASRIAQDLGMTVSGFFMIITQAPLDWAEAFIGKVVGRGSFDAITLPDTNAVCLPQAISYLVRKVRGWTGLPVEIHTHNHYSMGVATSLAGVAAGAEVVHASINGLGEGGGNAPLEAVALNLELLLGVETGIRLDRIYDVCRLVAELSGIPLQANWPIAGDRVFTVESGIAVDIGKKIAEAGLGRPPQMEIPAVLGRQRQMVVGKKSGRSSIELKMRALGMAPASSDQVAEILDRVKAEAVRLHRALTDDEFRAIAGAVVGG